MRESFSGLPVKVTGPSAGWSSSTNIPRCASCGSAATCAMSCTGPTGTPMPESTSTHSAVVFLRIAASMIGISSSRCSVRSHPVP